MVRTAYDFIDERQSLTKREREILRSLNRKPMAYAEGRNWSNEYRALLGQGLIFHGMGLISITPKGEEVLERVG